MRGIRDEAEALADWLEGYSVLSEQREQLAWDIMDHERSPAWCRVSTRLADLVAIHVDPDVQEESIPLIVEAMLAA